MREEDIETALTGVILAEIGSLPFGIQWPNQEYDGDRPYAELSFVGGQRNRRTLSSGRERSRGILLCVIVSELHMSTQTASSYAEQIADLFPMGKLISITGGVIEIYKPCDLIKGMRDNNDWRTPTSVFYEVSSI